MFFAPGRKYIVLGSSTSPFKFGNRILKWYINHDLDVIPINPNSDIVCGLKAYKSLNEYLKNDTGEVSISVVTPPNVSLNLFREVKNNNNEDKIEAIWFQPGSYDDKVINYVRNDLGIKSEGSVISDGDCILVSGIERMKSDLKNN